MAKHFAQITNALSRYLHTDKHLHQSNKHTLKNHHSKQLPPALQVSVLRGEALVRLQVFAYLASRGFDDNFKLLAYQQIFSDSMVISDFCSKIGLIEVAEDYIKQGAGHTADSYQAVCWLLYCILVDRLDKEEQHQLVNKATIGITHHYLPSFFPKIKEVKPSLEQLKKRCQIGLNRHFNVKIRLKESFTCDDSKEKNGVDFRLVIYLPNYHPCEVVHISAHRTRSARFQAYHQLADLLESGGFDIQPTVKIAKKKQKIQPLI